jgi:hypothetical protein
MRKEAIYYAVSVLLMAGMTMSASANFLPESSHYQGNSYFGGGSVAFAVYDTQAYANEFVGTDGYSAPGSGRYVYAYQVNLDESFGNVIDYFGIVGLEDGAVSNPENDSIGFVDDNTGGIAGTQAYFTSSSNFGKMGVWELESMTGGQHSWMLVLSSDYDRKAGTYTFDKTVADQLPVAEIPEPVSILMLGLGAVILKNKLRKTN